MFLIAGFSAFFLGVSENRKEREEKKLISRASITQTPTPKLKSEYEVALVGDSMTHALGPHGGNLNKFINELYKKHGIFVDTYNYAQSSKSILSLQEQMTEKVRHGDVEFEPLLSREFDLVLIESFGYNPLSQYGIEEGLRVQNQALGEAIAAIKSSSPKTKIVFIATISPNRSNYGLGANPGATIEDTQEQADERIAYIKNHIKYAEENGIPVINIFEKSLKDGDGNLDYINPDDLIHPSAVGLDFISREISNFIYNRKILPY